MPLGKLGYHLPRTLSTAIGSNSASMDPEEPTPPFRLRDRITTGVAERDDRDRRTRDPPRPVFQIGGSVIQSTKPDVINLDTVSPVQQATPTVENTPNTRASSTRSSKRGEAQA